MSKEFAKALLISVLLALMIKATLLQTFKIPSDSMEDTLDIGDFLLVNKIIYGFKLPFSYKRWFAFRDPHKGDVAVFKYPLNRDLYFIKRVVGEPGDVIEGRDKTIYVNGVVTSWPEVHKETDLNPSYRPQRDTFGPFTVPPGHYFMLGDNRDRSQDSRYWGPVRRDDMVGVALFKYWSWDRYIPRFRNIGRWVN